MTSVSEEDWAKFGLNKSAEGRGPIGVEGANVQTHSGFAPGELFGEDQNQHSAQPWWKSNFFVKEPILFGTWDGVFTSVTINIFGMIVFLRTGWMVGVTGVGDAVLVLFMCTMLSLMPILSAIGICERCQIQSGGVYFLISHILGAKIGGAIAVLYSFGQAVASALVAFGFGESMTHLLGSESGVLSRLLAIILLCLLVAVNIAGVKWVIKMQLVLLVILVLAVLDICLGSMFRTDYEYGVVGYSSLNFANNTGYSNDTDISFFTVFGVFFSNFAGVLSGVNMSGDLRDPSTNIPLGELSALSVSSSLILLMIMVLGGSCERSHLISDFMIAERLSATRVIFLLGLYVSSASAILGSLYGAPRVLQSLAAENTIPFMKRLEEGRGPNKIPVLATFVTLALAILFVLIGELNTLALIVTMPFLLTYAYVNYAYVSLAMTYDMQEITGVTNSAVASRSYGSMHNMKADGDLDKLFPERKAGPGGRIPKIVADDDKTHLIDDTEAQGTDDAPLEGPAMIDKVESKPTIVHQPQSWYSFLCNRWVALVGAVLNVLIILLVHFGFALAHLLLFLFLYVYIGQANPGTFPGISEFSIPLSIQLAFSKFRKDGNNRDDQVIVTPLHPGLDTLKSTLTEDNTDYANRKQYHQTKTETLDDFD